MPEHMASQTYDPATVYRTACRLLGVESSQIANRDKVPAWLPMARQAVYGAIYELCNISYPQLSVMAGKRGHAGTMDQVHRFRDRWPHHMRRSWLEAVLVRLESP